MFSKDKKYMIKNSRNKSALSFISCDGDCVNLKDTDGNILLFLREEVVEYAEDEPMSSAEYHKQMQELIAQDNRLRKELNMRYISERRRFANGDIIVNKQRRIIKVTGVRYSRPFSLGNSSNVPMCVYVGVECTQKLVPRKDGSSGSMIDSPHEQLTKLK